MTQASRAAPIQDVVEPDELVNRAREIAKTLVAKQAETEARTFYDEETHHNFATAGLYRLLVPKRYGGYEHGIDTFWKATMEVAAGCSSTGWLWTLGSGHALQVASLFSEQIQDEVFANPDLICPSVIRASGTAARRADGDWEISGTFPYCSGAPYSTWFMGYTNNADGSGPVTFLAPRAAYTRLDDWGGQLGMNGSGSHSLKMDQAILPARFVFPGFDQKKVDLTHGTVGSRLHNNPMYAGSTGTFFIGGFAAMMVGIAKNGLAAYEELMHKNVTFGPPGARTGDFFFQTWYGTALGKILAAEAIVVKCAEYWMEAARDRAFTPEFEMQLTNMFREASDLAWASMADIMMRTAGTSALLNDARMQRVWRDMSTARSHNGIVFYHETSKAMLAKAHFGVE